MSPIGAADPSDQADGTVYADSVKLVRDNSAEVDNEKQIFGYAYDPDGSLTTITDSSPNTAIDTYALTYNGLDQLAKVEEKAAGVVKNTTSYTYNENSAVTAVNHGTQNTTYSYDARDLVNSLTTTETGQTAKTTGYTYTTRGQVATESKPNNNTVTYGYYLDGALSSQVEKKNDATLVSQHTLDYDPNGNKTSDASKVMNADNNGAYLDETHTYTYNPQNQVTNATKKAADGTVLSTETYAYDPNGNVTTQTVGGTTSGYHYDRNRLLSATTSGTTANYTYDPYGRLTTVIAAGTIIEKYTYDGFDRTATHGKLTNGTLTTTSYTYDPLDRVTSETEHAGTTNAETRDFTYLGITNQLVTEKANGQLDRAYTYDAFGQKLTQRKHDTTTGTDDTTYYGYNPHTDVETLTDDTGNTKSTYGYTAYGANDTDDFTGIDKPDTQDPTKQPYNYYRYNAKRLDPASGAYDMGFRTYDPGINRFATRDNYNGALADLNLTTDPWTGNRYAFTGGNPTTRTELDGHEPMPADCANTTTPLCYDYYYGNVHNGKNEGKGWSGNADSPINAPGWFLKSSAEACSWNFDCMNHDAPNKYTATPDYHPAPNSIDQPCRSFGQCLDVLAQIGLMVCTISSDGTCGIASKAAQLLGRGGSALLGKIFGGGEEAAPASSAANGERLRGQLSQEAGRLPGIRSADDIFDTPSVLRGGVTPDQVRPYFVGQKGWREETLGKGGHQGFGWVIREYTSRGIATGRMLRWHPGDGHHGEGAYWRVIGYEGDLAGVIR